MDMMPEGEMAPQRSWWSRNWKWVVPSGCLGLLLSCGCLGAVIFGVAFQSLRSAGVVVEAVAMAKQSPEVRQALGEEIKAGMLVSGSLQSSNDRGSADITIPLDGSKADGTLHVEAYKDGEEWKFTQLLVEVPGRPPIDLLGGGVAPPPDTVPFPESLPDVEPLPEDGETGEPPSEAPEGQEDIEL
jgi:Cytochrome oxidase complex assembly protein 1